MSSEETGKYIFCIFCQFLILRKCWMWRSFLMEENDQGPISRTIFQSLSKFDGKLFCSHASCSEVITMKYCTWHGSCAVMACDKFCSDKISHNGVTPEPIIHQILINMKKNLLKWAPVYLLGNTTATDDLETQKLKVSSSIILTYPDSKVHWVNMGPTWVLSAPDGPHVGPMNHGSSQRSFQLQQKKNKAFQTRIFFTCLFTQDTDLMFTYWCKVVDQHHN